MTAWRDWRVPIDRDLCQQPGGRRQVQADVKRGIRLDAVTEVILQVIVNPKGGTYRPLSGSSRVPGQSDARLKQLLGVVLEQAGWAGHRTRAGQTFCRDRADCRWAPRLFPGHWSGTHLPQLSNRRWLQKEKTSSQE